MTYIEQAIKEAEAAGLKLPVGYQFVIATNARRFGQNTANEMFYMWLLSKAETWQALGKARGWNVYRGDDQSHDCDALGCSSIAHILRTRWRHEWHRFINHLAAGEDAESFFKSLYEK